MLLLGFLSTRPGRQAGRQAAAAALWPDQSDQSARHCLATTLWRLRAGIGADLPLYTTAETLRLDDGVWTDVALFQARALRNGRASCRDADSLLRLRRTVRSYGGDLLEGDDHEWLGAERERLRCLFLDRLYMLCEAELAAGNSAAAVELGRRLCAIEPLREDGHRLLMEALLLGGNRGLALKQYDLCVRALATELGVDPMPETRALAERIAERRIPRSFAPYPPSARSETLTAIRSALLDIIDLLDGLENPIRQSIRDRDGKVNGG